MITTNLRKLFWVAAFLAGGVPIHAATLSCIAAPSGLVGWWPGDSSENDVAGGNNPSVVSGVNLISGEVLNGFSLGTEGYILVPSSPSLAHQTFTWSAWARPDGPGPKNDYAGNKILEQNVDSRHVSVAMFMALHGRPVCFSVRRGRLRSYRFVRCIPVGPFLFRGRDL